MPSLGELDELLLEFHVFVEVELIDLVRVLLVTCVVVVVCLVHFGYGDVGTEKSIAINADMLLFLLSQLRAFLLLF